MFLDNSIFSSLVMLVIMFLLWFVGNLAVKENTDQFRGKKTAHVLLNIFSPLAILSFIYNFSINLLGQKIATLLIYVLYFLLLSKLLIIFYLTSRYSDYWIKRDLNLNSNTNILKICFFINYSIGLLVATIIVLYFFKINFYLWMGILLTAVITLIISFVRLFTVINRS